MVMNSCIKFVAEQWLADKSKYIKKSTALRYSCTIESINRFFDCHDISLMTEEYIQQKILRWLKNHSISSTKSLVVVLKMLFKFAESKGIKAPLVKIKYPSKNITSNNNKIETMSENEVNTLTSALLDTISNCKSLGILLVLNSGIRLGELCGIKISDIDLNNKTFRIDRTIQRVYDNKLHKTVLVTQTPKTMHSCREIPISSSMFSIIKNFVKNKDSSAYLASGTLKAIEPRNMQKYYKTILIKNHIRYVKFHALRHTFATRLIDKGANAKSVSEILGHSSVNITLNLYVHPSIESKRECIDLLCNKIYTDIHNN
jgi:integrase